MNGQSRRNEGECCWCELYAAGALSPDEHCRFEAHLAQGCEHCSAELRDLAPVIEKLFMSAPQSPVPSLVRERLMQRIEKSEPTLNPQIWRNWTADESGTELFTLRADQGGWEDTGVEGVFIRRLFVDKTRNEMTAMIRMEPGASYPRHIHDGPEQCLVLKGDLHVGDLVMHEGDYQRASAGSPHVEQRTEFGCLLLITSSLTDELH